LSLECISESNEQVKSGHYHRKLIFNQL